jgi:hypothetical protein
MADEFQHPGLDKLPADVRTRVQDALKETLERTIANEATAAGRLGGVNPVAAHSRSQGAFFSRSKTSDIARGGDDVVIEQVTKLDDAAFDKFADRLSKLKNLNRPG